MVLLFSGNVNSTSIALVKIGIVNDRIWRIDRGKLDCPAS